MLFNGSDILDKHIIYLTLFLVMHLCVNRCLSKDQWRIFLCTSSWFGKTFSNELGSNYLLHFLWRGGGAEDGGRELLIFFRTNFGDKSKSILALFIVAAEGETNNFFFSEWKTNYFFLQKLKTNFFSKKNKHRPPAPPIIKWLLPQ